MYCPYLYLTTDTPVPKLGRQEAQILGSRPPPFVDIDTSGRIVRPYEDLFVPQVVLKVFEGKEDCHEFFAVYVPFLLR